MRYAALFCALLTPGLCLAAAPRGAPAAECRPAISAAERAFGTAPGLLAAIGLVESGRPTAGSGVRQPWPWTVTAEGVGTFYPNKAAAIQAVQALQQAGVSSIDVGCMQVNLLHHPDAFHDLDQAFDPAANARYAARFLAGLHTRLSSWPAAAAAYHSLTPALGLQYGRLVAAVWSGQAEPVADIEPGVQVVRFPDGGQMRVFRDAALGPGRVFGYLSGP